jgi:hypothetical protein
MEQSRGEAHGPFRQGQIPGQQIGHQGHAHRVAPQSQAIAEIARGGPAENPGGAAGDDNLQQFLGAQEQQGLVEGMDFPAQTEER